MYNCEEYTRPIWAGDRVTGESFLPMSREVKLIYYADEIESVTDMTGKTEFKAGKDYVLRDGGLYIPEGSAIRVITQDEYNPAERSEEKHTGIGFTCKNGGYLMFSEGTFFHEREYAVTYRHSDSWDGPVPFSDPSKLPKTKALLREGKPFTFGFLGDSIATGANASAMTGIEPFAPIWPRMICERLTEKYGCAVNYINRSVGGTASEWGIGVAEREFSDNIPDVFLIAFGMNDASGGVDKYVFRDNNRRIAEKILALNPDCELLFVSTTLPNPLASQFVRDHDTHELLLAKLAGEFGSAADIVPMTSMHRYLLTKKSYPDMTGNNINHPNDFLIRVYAQSVLAVLEA